MTSFAEKTNNIVYSHLANISSAQDQISRAEGKNCKAYGIFDGHGGGGVSYDLAFGRSVMDSDDIPSLCSLICSNIDLSHDVSKGMMPYTQVEDVITRSFKHAQDALSNYHYGTVGSTATVVVIHNNHFYIATVGDSMAMVFKNDEHFMNTLDHKVIGNQEESDRIEASNASITKTTGIEVISDDDLKVTEGIYHNFPTKYLNYDMVAMSRSFGHYGTHRDTKDGETCALISVPTICSFPIESDVVYKVFFASDGVWDMIKADGREAEIHRLIMAAREADVDVAKYISDFCVARWQKKWMVHTIDRGKMEYTMTRSVEWDDISTYYLEF